MNARFRLPIPFCDAFLSCRTDYGLTLPKSLILCGPHSNPIPKNYLGFRYKKWLIDGKHGQGTHSTKFGAAKSTKSTPNAPQIFVPTCPPKAKGLRFSKKALFVLSPCLVLFLRTVGTEKEGASLRTLFQPVGGLGYAHYNTRPLLVTDIEK